jgi:hypothetical protein
MSSEDRLSSASTQIWVDLATTLTNASKSALDKFILSLPTLQNRIIQSINAADNQASFNLMDYIRHMVTPVVEKALRSVQEPDRYKIVAWITGGRNIEPSFPNPGQTSFLQDILPSLWHLVEAAHMYNATEPRGRTQQRRGSVMNAIRDTFTTLVESEKNKAQMSAVKRQEQDDGPSSEEELDDWLQHKDEQNLEKWKYGILSKGQREQLYKDTMEAKKAGELDVEDVEGEFSTMFPEPSSTSSLVAPQSTDSLGSNIGAITEVLLSLYQDTLEKMKDLEADLQLLSTPSVSDDDVSGSTDETPVRPMIESDSTVPDEPLSAVSQFPDLASELEDLDQSTYNGPGPVLVDPAVMPDIEGPKLRARLRRHAREFETRTHNTRDVAPKSINAKLANPPEVLGKYGTLNPYGMLPQLPKEDADIVKDDENEKIPDESDENDNQPSYEDLPDSPVDDADPELDDMPPLDPFGQLPDVLDTSVEHVAIADEDDIRVRG